MNCTTIKPILETIDPDRTFQLWGLANGDNLQYCDWKNMLGRLVEMRDFQKTLQNPLYQAQIMNIQVDSVFYSVCYAYSVLRIFILVVLCFYVSQKLQEIFREMEEILNFTKENTQNETSQINLGATQIHLEQTKKPQEQKQMKSKFSRTKRQEISIYKHVIYLSIILELICAARDFFLFRGLLLYTNITDAQSQLCYIDLLSGDFTCSANETVILQWQPFNYTRSECDCLYYSPEDYLSTNQKDGGYMTFSILLWIITEGLTMGAASFTILTLSRINRREKSGWNFIKPTILKSIIITVSTCSLFTIMIYYFGFPLYYRFFNSPVIVFYFFWKVLGFIMVFDRLYSKIWMEWRLRFQSLHSHGINWTTHMEGLKNSIKQRFGTKVDTVLRHIHQDQVEKQFDQFIQQNFNDIQNIYNEKLEKYYQDSIQPHIARFEREANAKLRTRWYDYLNYLLIINLIGIVGYFFLIIYSFVQENTQSQSLFWIGFVLALIELIVFEISNIFFILHGFFIELYKHIKQMEQQNNIDEEVYLVKKNTK